MTQLNGTINDFIQGDDLEIERTVSSIPDGVLIDTAWFTVKRKFSDSDADAVISKEITSALDTDGQITDTGVDGTGVIVFNLSPDDTASLTALKQYVYSIKIRLNNSRVNTPEIGIIMSNPTARNGE